MNRQSLLNEEWETTNNQLECLSILYKQLEETIHKDERTNHPLIIAYRSLCVIIHNKRIELAKNYH